MLQRLTTLSAESATSVIMLHCFAWWPYSQLLAMPLFMQQKHFSRVWHYKHHWRGVLAAHDLIIHFSKTGTVLGDILLLQLGTSSYSLTSLSTLLWLWIHWNKKPVIHYIGTRFGHFEQLSSFKIPTFDLSVLLPFLTFRRSGI